MLCRQLFVTWKTTWNRYLLPEIRIKGQTFVATINYIEWNDIKSKCNHFWWLWFISVLKKASKHTNNAEQYEQSSQLLNAFVWCHCRIIDILRPTEAEQPTKKVHSTDFFVFFWKQITKHLNHLPGSIQNYFDNISLLPVANNWLLVFRHSIPFDPVWTKF